MENLVRLVHCLKPGEIQFIRDFYRTKFQGNSSKRLQLLEFILQGKIRSNEDIARLLYDNHASTALCHLKKNLHHDILNLIIATTSNGNINQEIKNEICCRKLLIQGKILLSRGVYSEGISLLKKTSKLAEKYDFPDIRLASYDILRKYSSKVSLKQYNDLLNRSLSDYCNLLEAKKPHFSTQRHSDISLDSLKQKCLKKSSNKAYYWYSLSMIIKLYQEQEYLQAELGATKLMHFIKMEPTLYSHSKEADISLILSKVQMQLHKYSQASSFAQSSLELVHPSSRKFQQISLVLFFAYFRENRWSEAEVICQKALSKAPVNSLWKSRWPLLKAALYFSLCKYKEVTKSLLHSRETNHEDPRWQVSSRLLEILTILELEDYDWYEFRFESFRKKLAQSRSKMDDRLSVIYYVFRSLLKVNFDYLALFRLENENINRLVIPTKELHWDPMGYELINIPQWLSYKAGISI